jgi:hypothetical protein
MSLDRQLIDTIKMHFDRKSSAQLQEIVEATNQDRWSSEAIAAADEVLLERMAGSTEEPLVAEEELPPPPRHPDPFSLALIVGLASLGGAWNAAVRAYVHPDSYIRGRQPSNVDEPVPFGPKMAWLALDTTDTEAVATAMGLREARAATWAEGIDAAYQSSVFVTPPLADWTLAVGAALFPPDRADAFVKPLLERLSRQFGDAQYFCTHRDVELHVWARARQGQLVRAYGWLGEKSLTLWDEGAPTKEERDLGFRFSDGRSPAAEQAQNKEAMLPGEEDVMLLASYWSIDPTTLDEQFKEPLMGLLGNVVWGEGRPSQ